MIRKAQQLSNIRQVYESCGTLINITSMKTKITKVSLN